MVKLQKIGVVSSVKVHVALMGILGLFCGIIYSFGGFIIDILVSVGWVRSSDTPGLSDGTILAFGALIAMPVLFSLVGFAYGSMAAILYNLVASRVGGIECEFKQ